MVLMIYRTALIAVKNNVLSIGTIVALALTVEPQAFAQQPAPAEAAQNSQQLQVIFSPWTRYCATGPTGQSSEIRAKEVCFTAADGHLASGQKLVIALLIEPEGSDTKLFRVTLPLGVALIPGARIVIDEKEGMNAPFVVCLGKNGCMADYRADADLIEKLKKGHSLAVQAFDKSRPVSFTLPLTGFAKAYDGPPSDSTLLNELQEGLPNEPQ
jgi:invasion protein IalB